jgi:hypothetical protein
VCIYIYIYVYKFSTVVTGYQNTVVQGKDTDEEWKNISIAICKGSDEVIGKRRKKI